MPTPTNPAAPSFYGNVFMITRTPWDITLHILHGIPALDVKAGSTINLADHSTVVARVTLPVEVGKALIKALEVSTSDQAIKVESAEVTTAEAHNGRRR